MTRRVAAVDCGTNSVDPPPISTTRNGPPCVPSSSAVAPVNDSMASSDPVSTSGATPSISLTWRMNSAVLLASLVALVATMRTGRAAVAAMTSA